MLIQAFLSLRVIHGPFLLSFPSSLYIFSQKSHVIKERSWPCPGRGHMDTPPGRLFSLVRCALSPHSDK